MNEAQRIEALRRIASSGPRPMEFPDDGRTYWNGEPTPARRVRIIVGPSPAPTWWCAGLEGQERDAVEVEYGGQRFYLDNADGRGWRKVTIFRGSPSAGHASLPAERVLEIYPRGETDTPASSEEG